MRSSELRATIHRKKHRFIHDSAHRRYTGTCSSFRHQLYMLCRSTSCCTNVARIKSRTLLTCAPCSRRIAAPPPTPRCQPCDPVRAAVQGHQQIQEHGSAHIRERKSMRLFVRKSSSKLFRHRRGGCIWVPTTYLGPGILRHWFQQRTQTGKHTSNMCRQSART